MQAKVITAHIPLDLAGRLDRMSVRLQRSRAWIVQQALSAWLEQSENTQNEGRFAMTNNGFAEARQTFDFGLDQQSTGSMKATDAVASLHALRKTTTLGDISWRELRDTGRK